jgi:hypothetical protein
LFYSSFRDEFWTMSEQLKWIRDDDVDDGSGGGRGGGGGVCVYVQARTRWDANRRRFNNPTHPYYTPTPMNM